MARYSKYPDNRSTDPSTSSGCSAVHGESVEPSQRSLCSSASKLKSLCNHGNGKEVMIKKQYDILYRPYL
ncbi:MAG: hypothetical protein HY607_01410 [Planctomycetes bacterium]|nr:hypothetical protein [Planctomycetota bacterium]